MEHRQLRYFIAVAEEKSISRAAERLHMTQPPLTRQILDLERSLGTRLLVRSVKGVDLTDAGTRFLEDARQVMGMLEAATARARSAEAGEIGRIDIAVFGSVILDTLPQLLARFRASRPGVEIVMHTMNKGEQIEALRQRRITLGFSRLTSDYPDMISETLKSEQLVLAVPAGHPLARRRRVAFADLAGHPMILFASGPRPNFMDVVLSLCQRANVQPLISQTVEDSVTGLALVAAGFGACPVPAAVKVVVLPGVVFVPMTGVPPGVVDVNCVVRRDDTSPLTQAFLCTLRRFREE